MQVKWMVIVWQKSFTVNLTLCYSSQISFAIMFFKPCHGSSCYLRTNSVLCQCHQNCLNAIKGSVFLFEHMHEGNLRSVVEGMDFK